MSHTLAWFAIPMLGRIVIAVLMPLRRHRARAPWWDLPVESEARRALGLSQWRMRGDLPPHPSIDETDEAGA